MINLLTGYVAGSTCLSLGLGMLSWKYYKLSNKDERTGAYNMRSFTKKIIDAMKREKKFGVLFLDLDKFKELNDTRGHAYGDFILRLVVTSLHKKLKRGEIVARYGGDEFVVYLTITSEDELERRKKEIKQVLYVAGIRVSVGGRRYKKSYGVNYEKIMRVADKDMYKEKNKGSVRNMNFYAVSTKNTKGKEKIING